MYLFAEPEHSAKQEPTQSPSHVPEQLCPHPVHTSEQEPLHPVGPSSGSQEDNKASPKTTHPKIGKTSLAAFLKNKRLVYKFFSILFFMSVILFYRIDNDYQIEIFKTIKGVI